ncbi:MAG: transposase [Acidimicrobiales bacterium]
MDSSARIITNENSAYTGIGVEYERGHEAVCYSAREYVRIGSDVHSTPIEGFFSIVKREINGIYHAVSKEHLHHYLAEYEFRYTHRQFGGGEQTARSDPGG